MTLKPPFAAQVLGATHGDGSLRLWDAARGDLLSRLGDARPDGPPALSTRARRHGLAFSPVNAKFVASTRPNRWAATKRVL